MPLQVSCFRHRGWGAHEHHDNDARKFPNRKMSEVNILICKGTVVAIALTQIANVLFSTTLIGSISAFIRGSTFLTILFLFFKNCRDSQVTP